VSDCLKLTAYFGESDRAGGRLLSDELMDRFADVHASVLLRAVEGFGPAQHLRTDRILTLSEDLPLVAVAVGDRAQIEALVPDVHGGLVTLEAVRLVDGPVELEGETKLTLYLGRDEPHVGVVDHLRRSGLAGATVLLGVDGTAHGRRQRARFFSRNAEVPQMVVAVGPAEAVEAALAGLDGDTIATVERVRVCKRDGVLAAEPHALAEGRQRLTVYASEQAHHRGRPLHAQLVRRLREEGAAGATALRGIWGFSGDHAPHGDRLFALHRHVPVVTTLVDTAEQMARWFPLVDELTDEAGLVTSELVPDAR
jgi:PII-like signaling protein